MKYGKISRAVFFSLSLLSATTYAGQTEVVYHVQGRPIKAQFEWNGVPKLTIIDGNHSIVIERAGGFYSRTERVLGNTVDTQLNENTEPDVLRQFAENEYFHRPLAMEVIRRRPDLLVQKDGETVFYVRQKIYGIQDRVELWIGEFETGKTIGTMIFNKSNGTYTWEQGRSVIFY